MEFPAYTVLSNIHSVPDTVLVQLAQTNGGAYTILKTIYAANMEELTEVMQEAYTMCSLSHPNIISMNDACINSASQGLASVTIFMKYYRNGDLDKEIKRRAAAQLFWSEAELHTYMYQLLSACAYLENLDIAHRDIKPHNIFIDDDLRLVLADLGSAKKFVTGAQTIAGTPLYLSPALRQAYSKMTFGETVNHDAVKSDVWSLGLTFLFMATLIPVTDLAKINDVPASVQRRVEGIPYPFVQQIVAAMLVYEESARPTFLQLLTWLNWPVSPKLTRSADQNPLILRELWTMRHSPEQFIWNNFHRLEFINRHYVFKVRATEEDVQQALQQSPYSYQLMRMLPQPLCKRCGRQQILVQECNHSLCLPCEEFNKLCPSCSQYVEKSWLSANVSASNPR